MTLKIWTRAAQIWKRGKNFLRRWPHDDVVDPVQEEHDETPPQAASTASNLGSQPQAAEHVTLSPVIQHELENSLQRFQQEQVRIYKQLPWPLPTTPSEDDQKKKRRRWIMKTKRRLTKPPPQPPHIPQQAFSDAFAAGQMLQASIMKLLALNEQDYTVELSEPPKQMRELHKWDSLPLPVREGESTLDTYWMARQDSGLLDGLMGEADEDFEEWQAEREMFLDQGQTLDPSHEDIERQYLAYREQLDAEYEVVAARVNELYQRCLDEGIDPHKTEEEPKQDSGSLLKKLRAGLHPDMIEEAIASGRIEHEVIPGGDQQEDSSSIADAPTLTADTGSRIADWLAKEDT